MCRVIDPLEIGMGKQGAGYFITTARFGIIDTVRGKSGVYSNANNEKMQFEF